MQWRLESHPSQRQKKAKTVKAKELWNDIGYAAWASADQGYNLILPLTNGIPAQKAGVLTPPSLFWYMFLDDTACNLASLNLIAYQKENGQLDTQSFSHSVKLWTVTLEISVLMAQFPSKEIALRSYDFRTLGLGFANIGGYLMAAGIPYMTRKKGDLSAELYQP